MEVIRKIGDFFWCVAWCIYIVPLCVACKICGVTIDD